MKTQSKQKVKILKTNGVKVNYPKAPRFSHETMHFRNIEKANDTPLIGIEAKNLFRVTEILNEVLSNQHVLYLKTRNFHWNLVGRRFHTLHVFLEEQYKLLEAAIDETAERTRMVGGVPHASMREFIEDASLQEDRSQLVDGDDVIEHLLADHEKSIQLLRPKIEEVEEKLKDAGTADFLTNLMKSHEKMAWMLRSHLV